MSKSCTGNCNPLTSPSNLCAWCKGNNSGEVYVPEMRTPLSPYDHHGTNTGTDKIAVSWTAPVVLWRAIHGNTFGGGGGGASWSPHRLSCSCSKCVMTPYTVQPGEYIRLKQLPGYWEYHKLWLEHGDPADLAKALAVAGNDKALDDVIAHTAQLWSQKYDCGRDRAKVKVARICPCEACQQFVTDAQANPWSWWDCRSNEFQNAIGGMAGMAVVGGVISAATAGLLGIQLALGMALPEIGMFLLSIVVVAFTAWRMP